jgi:hypothetical protein
MRVSWRTGGSNVKGLRAIRQDAGRVAVDHPPELAGGRQAFFDLPSIVRIRDRVLDWK